MIRTVWTIVAALALAGCGKGDGIVVVSVSSTAPLGGVSELRVQSTLGGRSSTETVHPSAPFSLPPAKTFGIQVASNLSGTFAVAVDALDGAGNVMASANGSATLAGGGRADIELVFDAGAGDMGGGGDGGSGNLAGTCPPLTGLACLDPNTLQQCAADGVSMESVPCPKGCTTTGSPHCQLVTPTGIAPANDFNAPGIGAVTLASATMHSDSGQIDGVRAANGNPTTLSVDATSGIGFHLVTQGGSTVGVFVMRGLTVTGTLTIVGLYPAVILANGDVNIVKVDVSANCTARTPGAGGYAGGTTVVGAGSGLGPGGGGPGVVGSYTGAGGGGHGDHGGKGADQGATIGGAGGALNDAATLAILHGGSGGGAQTGGNYPGGAGGGAVQMVSQTKIVITGGIAAGGCGGLGSGDVQGGATCSGGGAGGAILLEAPTVSVGDNGYLVCGGGGGGGVDTSGGNGEAAANSNLEVATGRGGTCGGSRCGGQGGYSGSMVGGPGTAVSTLVGGCGGGAVGRIRVNTQPSGATFSSVMTLYVPTMASMNSIGESGFSTGPIVIK